MLTDHLIQNRWILEIIFSLIMTTLGVLISTKIHRLYAFSKYPPLKIFSHAFLFYSISFVFRIARIITYKLLDISKSEFSFLTATNTAYIAGDGLAKKFLFLTFPLALIEEYTILIAGMLLVYSFVWKKLHKNKTEDKWSHIIHITAFMIALITAYTGLVFYSYILELFVFIFALIYSYGALKKSKNKKMSRCLFTALLLISLTWLLYIVSWAVLVVSTKSVEGYVLLFIFPIAISGFTMIYMSISKMLKGFA